MKKKFVSIALILICAMASLYGGYSGVVSTNPNGIQTVTRNNYDIVSLKGNYTFTEATGSPQLPTKVLSYVIPMESSVESITIKAVEEQLLNGQKYNIYPTQPPRRSDEEASLKFIEQNADVYSSGRMYPEEIYMIKSEEYKYGYHVVTVEFYPVQYDTKTKSLKINSEIEFTMNYTPSKEAYIAPQKQSEKMFDVCKNLIRSKVENPDDINIVSGGPKKVVKQTNVVQKINSGSKSMPFPEFMVPEYIIITSKDLVDSNGVNVFKPLADWKIKKGIPTELVYLEDIVLNTTEGSSEADKLEIYLEDVYEQFGAIYILLGGDTNIIPTDSYYYDYDYDGFVGRASVEDVTEAVTFVNKTMQYEKLTGLTTDEKGYLKNMLMLSGIDGEGYIDSTNYAYSTPTTPYGIYKEIDSLYTIEGSNCVRLYEETIYSNGLYSHDMRLTKENTVDALNGDIDVSGATDDHFGIVLHMDHSDYTNIGTGNHSVIPTGYATEKFYREDADALTNGNFLNVLMSEGCNPGLLIKDCVAERFINNPDGGSVAVIAKSTNGDWNLAYQQREFIESIVNPEDDQDLEDGYHIGIALAHSGNSGNLFGDPELPVWNKAPETFDNVIVEILNADSGDSLVTTGENTITIDTNESFESLVCLYKSGEAYAYGYTTSGEIEFEYTPDTVGDLYITVSAKGYLPYETTETVSIPQDAEYAHLYISGKSILDGISSYGSGDGDGIADGGETIIIPIIITNSSNVLIENIYGTLSVNDTLVTVNSSSLQFSDLETNESDTVNFEFEVDPSIADGTAVEFTLNLTSDQGSFADGFNLRMKNYDIVVQERLDDLVIDGQTGIASFEVGLELSNIGNSSLGDFVVTITDNSSAIYNFSTDSIQYSSLDSLSIDSHTGHFSFDIDINTLDFENDRIQLNISDGIRSSDHYFGVLFCDSEMWDLSDLTVHADDVTVSSGTSQISLQWNVVQDFSTGYSTGCRYNIYRADSLNGEYHKLNLLPLETNSYTDINCEETTTYYYKIGLLYSESSQYITLYGTADCVGQLGEAIEASTSLDYSSGWPVEAEINVALWNTPTVSDYDDDGQKEIFLTGSDNTNKIGYVMGFNADGSEISQIGFPGDVCGFAKIDKASYSTTYGTVIWSSCALGDLDNDDVEEVVVATRSEYNSIMVFKKTTSDVSAPDTLMTWHLDPDNTQAQDYIFADPVLDDINNDGYKDIVFLTENGKLYVIDFHDSCYISNSGQLPSGVTGNHYGGLAVGDIDSDGNKDIVYGLKQGIYAVEWNGSQLTSPSLLFNYNYSGGEYYECKPAIANIDLEGNPEILVSSRINTTDDGKVYILNYDGSVYSSAWNGKEITKCSGLDLAFFHPSFAVANVDTVDYKPEIFIGGKGYLYGWDSEGDNLTGFPIAESNMDVWLTHPVLADVDGDVNFEIVMASANYPQNLMYAYNVEDGTSLTGWPLTGNGDAPYIGDIDNDGYNEIVTSDDASTTLVYESEGTFVPVESPEGLEISETDGTITLSWDEVFDATDYHIYRSENPDSDYEDIGDTENLTFDDPETSFDDRLFFYYVTANRYSPSEKVGFGKYTNVVNDSLSDLNYIALPFDAGYTLSSHFDPTGSYINTISKWNAGTQTWTSSSYVTFLGIWLNTYSVTEGTAFAVNVKNNQSMYICGDYIDIPAYQLVTTAGNDYNLIMHPIEKYNLTASDEIGDDIGACNQVSEWDAVNQGWNTSGYGLFGWSNIFDTHIGYPLYVNMTDSVVWPSESKKKGDLLPSASQLAINMPKAMYFNIVNTSKENYDFSDSNAKLEGNQPKDDFISFKAWVTGREEDVLTELSFGCGFDQIGEKYSTVFINVGNFKSKWSAGDEVNIVIADNSSKDVEMIVEGKSSVVLKNDANGVFRGFEPVIKGSGIPIVIGTPTGEEEMIPYETALYQNYPNPFNPVTMINFSLKDDCKANVRVYNYKGQLAQELVNGNLKRGNHSVEFNAGKLGSGVYFYTLEAGGKTFTRKMVLTK